MAPKLDVLSGPTPVSFKKLMSLKALGNDIFQSLTAAWPPAPHKRTFGGHVYAQALYAASKTVDTGMTAHSVNGHFILPGAIDTPFIYKVKRVRTGGIYCLRYVEVYQEGASDGSPVFISTVSFKRDEKGNKKWVDFEHQNLARDHIKKTYRDVLEGTRIEDHPLAPGADALWWEEEEADNWYRAAAAFPGVETRKVDMVKYNRVVPPGGGPNGEGASRWKQLLFYRLILEEGEDAEEPDLNLHAAAHCYASDRNSLFLIQRAMGYERVVTTMASLSHKVVFQGPSQYIRMTGQDGQSKWFVQESWTSNSGGNRGTHESRMWDYTTGRVVATTVQDGMIRFPSDENGKVKMTYEHATKNGNKNSSML